jgi:carboxypeptidase family protein
MFLKYLASTFVILLLAGSVSMKAESRGFMEGHLKIIFGMAVGKSDEMPRAEAAPESYAEYPLVVLSQEEKKEVARVTADENGNYRVPLPPGNYLLDVQDRARKHVRARPQPFTVASSQTVRVDMNIVIGIR